MTKLSEHQSIVLAAFKRPDTDIPIYQIFFTVYGAAPAYLANNMRRMQQKLAPSFRSVNEKLIGQRIEPGRTKQTYRLNTCVED